MASLAVLYICGIMGVSQTLTGISMKEPGRVSKLNRPLRWFALVPGRQAMCPKAVGELHIGLLLPLRLPWSPDGRRTYHSLSSHQMIRERLADHTPLAEEAAAAEP